MQPSETAADKTLYSVGRAGAGPCYWFAAFEVLIIGAGVAGWMAAHLEYCHHTAYLADERCLSYQAVVLFTRKIGQSTVLISPLISVLATVAIGATSALIELRAKQHGFSKKLIRQRSWLPSNRSRRWCQPRTSWVVTIAHALEHVGSIVNHVSGRDYLISVLIGRRHVGRTRWS